jgi:hypothetical protein
LRLLAFSLQLVVCPVALLTKTHTIVYSPTSIEGAAKRAQTKTPANPQKMSLAARVYSPTRNSVLPNKE